MAETAKVAYVFSPQGSQYVGMGRDLYDNFEPAKAVFEQTDEALGFPLSRICFDGPEDKLLKTINTQPAVAATSLACLEAAREVLSSKGLAPPAFVAGHSLGEYTALAAAGVLDLSTTVRLTRERGRLMYEAGLEKLGGMAAIIGLDEKSVAEVCDETGAWVSDINCSGNIVISGEKDDLTRATALAKARGANYIIPIKVSGAFHSPLMQPAVEGMSEILATLPFRQPAIPIIANVTAQPVITVELVKEELLNQLCNCVQWQRSVEYMINSGVSTFIEIGPGNVLARLIKRIDESVTALNIGNVQDIRNLPI